jgi:hypothetical protein
LSSGTSAQCKKYKNDFLEKSDYFLKIYDEITYIYYYYEIEKGNYMFCELLNKAFKFKEKKTL